MKTIIIVFMGLQLSLFCSAQINTNLPPVFKTNVSGLLAPMPILNMTVSQNANAILDFNFAEDLISGKEIPMFYRIEVVSDVPWVITTNADNNFFTSLYMPSNANNNISIPTSVMSLKNNSDNIYLPLNMVEQPILMGNATTSTVYYIDLKVNPSWDYSGGTYNTFIKFSIVPQ